MKIANHRKISEINLYKIPLDLTGSYLLKRLFDIVFSLVFIILIYWWLFPLIALLIKLDSTGPVIFVQKRTGLNNIPFNCYKFRSMRINDLSDIKQATANDSRITKIGHILRKTSLDEIPQFINVLLGQMSVVGPRPHMLKQTEVFSGQIVYYMFRHIIKPGVTGWAQVNGSRGETDELWKMEKRIRYDIVYIKKWTFWWDIRIILETIFQRKTYKNAR